MSNWGKPVQVFWCENGKEIPIEEHRRQQRLAALSDDARVVLTWLTKRKQSYVTLVQMSKCLMPVELRTAAIVRALMAELVAGGFAEALKKPLYYSGRWRREGWYIRPR